MSQKIEGTVAITSESDLLSVRKVMRNAARTLGFGVTDITRIVTAASELARNIYLYAGSGTVKWRRLDAGHDTGIELKFEDSGPGIPDMEQAIKPGYSTSSGLGMGLAGAKRLMDEFEIESEVGKGTKVTVRKWLKRPIRGATNTANHRGNAHQ